MGILNITPDSFYDGGYYLQAEDAFSRARTLIEQGADIIDIGGESSRPGAIPVSNDEELARVIPVIERIRANYDICISVDTTKPDVMQESLVAGASFINDISALTDDRALAILAAQQVPVCLMHMQGQPATMQEKPSYLQGVVVEINDFFKTVLDKCLQAGIKRECIILDPGIGFGKTAEHNLQIIKNFDQFKKHQLPLLFGVSRKSFIGNILGAPVHKRLPASLALTTYAVTKGASIIRTHDIEETKQALTILQAVLDIPG